jgi:hypothetical protein
LRLRGPTPNAPGLLQRASLKGVRATAAGRARRATRRSAIDRDRGRRGAKRGRPPRARPATAGGDATRRPSSGRGVRDCGASSSGPHAAHRVGSSTGYRGRARVPLYRFEAEIHGHAVALLRSDQLIRSVEREAPFVVARHGLFEFLAGDREATADARRLERLHRDTSSSGPRAPGPAPPACGAGGNSEARSSLRAGPRPRPVLDVRAAVLLGQGASVPLLRFLRCHRGAASQGAHDACEVLKLGGDDEELVRRALGHLG